MNQHSCERKGVPQEGHYGAAVTWCQEQDDGTFLAGNDEYGNQVNYCPFCGTKAPVSIDESYRWDDQKGWVKK